MFPTPTQVKAQNNFNIWIHFSDGTEGNVDLSHLVGKGVFKAWETENLFDKVYIERETKAIAWNEMLELCPDSLYLKLKGITFDEWKQQNYSYASNQ